MSDHHFSYIKILPKNLLVVWNTKKVILKSKAFNKVVLA